MTTGTPWLKPKVRSDGGIGVVLRAVGLLCCGPLPEVGSGGVLSADPLVEINRDGDAHKDADDDDHRIVAKLQTQGNSGFGRCSQKTVSGE